MNSTGEEQKTARAMAALDAMATIWAATFDLRLAVKSMMHLPDGEDRLIAFIKQGHVEGLYAGRTSYQPAVPSAVQSAELAALLKDGNAYCRILTLLGMEEEGDPVAEVERLVSARDAGPTQAVTMPPMNEDLVTILGRPSFTCIRPAQAMRMGGYEIRSKAEYEQAHVIHFFLDQYFLHGTNWAEKSNEALKAMVASAMPATIK